MASSRLLFVLPSFSSKALLKSSSLLVRVRPSPAQLGRQRGQGRGLWRGSVPWVCAQSWAEAGGCPCHPLLLPRWGKAGELWSRSPGASGGFPGGPSAHPGHGEPRISPSVLISLPSVSTAGLGGPGGRFWISPLAGAPTPAMLHHRPLRTLGISPRQPELWGRLPALDLGHLPKIWDISQPWHHLGARRCLRLSQPQEGMEIGASSCSLLVPVPSSPHLGHPTPNHPREKPRRF